jgi:hypothetical protein
MTQNNFTKLPHDISNKQQQNARNSKKIIDKNDKWKYINMNTNAPHIHGTIELHKRLKPISPIVNWKHSSSYISKIYGH